MDGKQTMGAPCFAHFAKHGIPQPHPFEDS